jgi:hypothetical protein
MWSGLLVRSAVFLFVIGIAWQPPVLAQSKKLDLSNPEDALKASRKIQCSLHDGEPAVYYWEGHVYSRMSGEKDRKLFNVMGMNVRACTTVTDPQRGSGYRLVSREIMLYLDPTTNQLLRTWKNPWTGKEVEVIHVANDPVNMRPLFARGPQGDYKFGGTIKDGWVWLTTEVPLFYTNPLAGDYQEYVGGNYQVIEMFNNFMREDDLLDASQPTVEGALVGWSRVSPWLPWMEMGDRPGQMIFHAAGKKLKKWDDLPDLMKREVVANYPLYKTPPPLDDNRPNETSWTYFKKMLDAKRSQQKKP